MGWEWDSSGLGYSDLIAVGDITTLPVNIQERSDEIIFLGGGSAYDSISETNERCNSLHVITAIAIETNIVGISPLRNC